MKRPSHIPTQWKALTMSIALHILVVVCLLLPINTLRQALTHDDTPLDSLPPIEQLLLDLETYQSILPTSATTVAESSPQPSTTTSAPLATYAPLSSNESGTYLSEETLYTDTLAPSPLHDTLRYSPPPRATIIERSVATITHQQTKPKETELMDNPAIRATLDSAISVLKENIAAHSTPRHTPFTDSEREQQNERYNFYRTNYRTIYNLLKVYPYALMVRDITQRVDSQLTQLPTERERRAYIRKTEKELFAQFEGIVKKMSYSQGRILLKLISRETGNSTYEIIKNYKGTFSASFWYSIGRLFTANLKDEYDKEGDDKVIEEILQRSEKGEYMLLDKGVYLY